MRHSWLVCLLLMFVLSGCRGITGVGAQEGSLLNAKDSLQGSVNHIIFMMQENRSFDHYFGKLGDYRAKNGFGAASDIDGLPANASNQTLDGTYVHSFHLETTCVEELSPDWLESHGDLNRDHPGSTPDLMNGFVFNAASFATENGEFDVVGARAMGYYDETDLPYYYFMASQFATSDRWFAPMLSNSIPNRIFMQAGSTGGHVHEPNTDGGACCDNLGTIYYILDQAGISWKIYYTDVMANGQPLTDLGNYWPKFATAHSKNIVPVSEYFKDVSNGTLPSVAFIQAGLGSGRDEHPGGQQVKGEGGNDIQTGARYVQEIINALMFSPSWKDSVFILSFDEPGSFYDHVSPVPARIPDDTAIFDLQPRDSVIQPPAKLDRTGFRLPMMVISPFTKKHYVSHTPADNTAIMKLISTRFKVRSLSSRDSSQMDMTEFFDFVNIPWATPPTPPDQPVEGRCQPANIPQSTTPTP